MTTDISLRLRHSTLLTTVCGLMLMICLASSPAQADLRVCNMTSSRVGLAVGYRDPQGWLTEGWFNLRPNNCESVLKGDLNFKYYYIHGIDYDRGGEWGGRSFMCTSEREFNIRGIENCLVKGHDRTGFFEIDTGEQKNWTVQLTEANRQSAPNTGDQPASEKPQGEKLQGDKSQGEPKR